MLERSFIHVPGIGKTTEQSLWNQGCANWQTYLNASERYSTGRADRASVTEFLEASTECLADRNHQFFAEHLGQKDAWRAFREFRDSCVYLDIETDGRAVTTIGLFDGSNFKCLLKGENLENFRDEISRYSMIVTFCGTGFDLPILQKNFRGLEFDQIHIDLCPVLRKLGYRGGLKKIEKDLGIDRPDDLLGLTGFDAVILWRRFYGLGDERALDKLIAYNREDCVNLQRLAEITVDRMEEATFAG